MDHVRTYDYLTRVRGVLFERIRPLDGDAWMREFAIGPGSLAATLTHIMISEWYYIARLEERTVPPYAEWPIRDEAPPSFTVIESTWRDQATDTRAALAAVTDWAQPIEYDVTNEHGVRQIVTASAGDLATQLALHEMHHRAQALNMLRQLGVTFDVDLDFNAQMYARRDA